MPRSGNKRLLRAGAVLLLCSVLLSGCIRTQIFDELGMITVAGYDLLKDGNIRGTVVMPSINPEAEEKVQVMSGISLTSKGIRDKANLQSDKEVLGGQLRVAMYSEELARKGIGSIVDTLYRDPSIGSRVYLSVIEGQTYDLLTYKFKEEGNIGIYLYQLIRHNVEDDKIPSPTLHEFYRSYFSEGIDPYVPFLERKGDEVRIKGVALFHKDKYVGWIPPKEAFHIKLVHDAYRAGTYETSVDPERMGVKPKKKNTTGPDIQMVFDTLSSKTHVDIVSTNPLTYKVDVKVRTRILEMSIPLKIEQPEVLRKMEQALSENMKQDLAKVVAKMQKWEVDPFGFGELYRAKFRGARKLSHDQWHEMYRKSRFDYNIDVEIVRNGVLD
ncbi:Ger(x)C family spore germination protein [Brevibacillus sp. FSL K6-6036]|uniref:Ger(x)C family spore germination protein n=1 Tax=Brevibacillus sp. FSL K6-6036 TaxID=2954682 RepID=UPI0030D3160F